MAGVHAAPLTHVQAPGKWLWDVDSYYAAWEAGIFGEDAKLELLDGEVYRKLSPQKALHATGIGFAMRALSPFIGSDTWLRIQQPLRLGWNNEPEPDLAVVRGSAISYLDHHPGAQDALLVVEVSDRTLGLDRRKKKNLYATHRIQEYWILNVRQWQLEVYRDPHDGNYNMSEVLRSGDTIVPLFSGRPLLVSELVP